MPGAVNPRAPRKAKVPMRKLYWSKLKPIEVKDSIFAHVSSGTVQLDWDEIEELFTSKKKPKVMTEEEKAEAEERAKRPKKVLLLDGKSSNAIGIMLARFRMPNEAIRDAILALDEKVLTMETVGFLVKTLPSSDAIATIGAYDGDMGLLGNSEKYVRAVMGIPRLAQRLRSMQIKLEFEMLAHDVEEGLVSLSGALTAIHESKALVKLFEIVLAIGNFMNGKKDQGFHLDLLSKLEGTKTIDGKSNLVRYLADLLEKEFPDVLEFTKDLEICGEAMRHPIDLVSSNAANLEKSIKIVSMELTQSGDPVFKDIFTAFHTDAMARIEAITQGLGDVESKHLEVCKVFAEKPAKVKADEMCAKFAAFVDEFVEAQEKNERARELEARKERRRKAKAEAAKKRKAKKKKKKAEAS